MPPSSLHATWLHGHRRPAWADMEQADQLFIMNCYVSREGWTDIAAHLDRLLTNEPATQVRLYLSFEGITNVGRDQLQEALIAFFDRHRVHTIGDHPALQVFIVPDGGGKLFHPKGYAVRAGGRFDVTIGSANLTRAAQGSNYEMELTRDDPATFKEFVAAAQKLESSGLVGRFKVKTAEKLREYISSREALRRAFARILSAHPREPGTSRDEALAPALEDAPVAPIPIALPEALASIFDTIMVGCRVVEQDLGLPNLSVSLRSFVTAGMIENPPQRTIAPGIKVGGDKTTSLLISLVPDEMIEAMKTIRGRQGYLLREFTIGLLGVRWMPLDWQPAFLHHWSLCREKAGALPLDAVNHHLNELYDNLSRGDFVSKLAQGVSLEVNTARWKPKAARRLIFDADLLDAMDRKAILTPTLKTAAFAQIAEYVREQVMNKLDRDTARLQVERVGAPPRFDHMPQASVGYDDAMDFVATMSEIVTRNSAGSSEDDREGSEDFSRRGGGTGVGRALVSLLRAPPSLQSQLRAHALQLRRCLTERKRSSDEEAELLIVAWHALRHSFSGGDFPRSWTVPPRWNPVWLKEPKKQKQPKQFLRLLDR